MNITQEEAVLNMVSQETVGYGYVHLVQDVTITETTVVGEYFTSAISYHTFKSDGYFIITEIKLPLTPGAGYYLDMNEELIYNPEGIAISAETLLDTDTEFTNIIRTDTDWLTMYLLRDYYLRLLKAKYLKNICSCGCGCIDNQDKIKLDTLTMGLDLIEALEAKNQYYEIQRIVEKLMVCFGMVDSNCNCD